MFTRNLKPSNLHRAREYQEVELAIASHIHKCHSKHNSPLLQLFRGDNSDYSIGNSNRNEEDKGDMDNKESLGSNSKDTDSIQLNDKTFKRIWKPITCCLKLPAPSPWHQRNPGKAQGLILMTWLMGYLRSWWALILGEFSINFKFPDEMYFAQDGKKEIVFVDILWINLPKTSLEETKALTGGNEFSYLFCAPKWLYELLLISTPMT